MPDSEKLERFLGNKDNSQKYRDLIQKFADESPLALVGTSSARSPETGDYFNRLREEIPEFPYSRIAHDDFAKKLQKRIERIRYMKTVKAKQAAKPFELCKRCDMKLRSRGERFITCQCEIAESLNR